jgi:hypothetical protein
VHALAPELLYFPGEQEVHAPTPVVLLLYCPALQAVHTDDDDAPAVAPY